jgi:formyl-CoA transferase
MEPLSGLKVIEMGQLIAGPFAAKTLADLEQM